MYTYLKVLELLNKPLWHLIFKKVFILAALGILLVVCQEKGNQKCFRISGKIQL